jgi:peptidoglycan/xylan/chitin deacetylase (PgdA/CDA1 family)
MFRSLLAALTPLLLAPVVMAQTPTPTATPAQPKVTYSSAYVGGQPYVAITFDDGPNSVQTPRLLEMLAKRNIKATFYVVGKCVVENPAIVKRFVTEGHEIGNHSWSHPKLSSMSQAAVHAELKKTHDAVIAACGVPPKSFRPPYGAFTEAQRRWAFDEFGYKTILWSIDPFDWKKPGAGVIAQRILTQAHSGAIILAHDIHKQTVDAMPETLDGLLAKGYKFVTVSELLAMDQPKPKPTPTASPIAAPASASLNTDLGAYTACCSRH